MGLRDALRNNENTPVVKQQKVFPEKDASASVIHNKKQKKHYHRNLKQIFVLSFDALRERKARSALTILMVVVGSALMVALNGLSAGAADFISKQLNFLAPNVIFVSPGQIGKSGLKGKSRISKTWKRKKVTNLGGSMIHSAKL